MTLMMTTEGKILFWPQSKFKNIFVDIFSIVLLFFYVRGGFFLNQIILLALELIKLKLLYRSLVCWWEGQTTTQ